MVPLQIVGQNMFGNRWMSAYMHVFYICLPVHTDYTVINFGLHMDFYNMGDHAGHHVCVDKHRRYYNPLLIILKMTKKFLFFFK